MARPVADRGGAQDAARRDAAIAAVRARRVRKASSPHAVELDAARLQRLIAGFAGKRILVIGDLMLDEFIWGKVSRISPEAPVPVVNVVGRVVLSRAARRMWRATSASSRRRVAVMGLAGADAAWRAAAASCSTSAASIPRGVQQDAVRATTVKTRIIARNQQVVRVDRERKARAVAGADAARHAQHLDARSAAWTRIVVADYGKGFLDPGAGGLFCARRRGAHGKVLAVDPHPHTSLMLAGRDRDQAESRRGVPRRRPAAVRSRSAGAGGRAAARGGPPPARDVEDRKPADHARGRRDAGPEERRAAVLIPGARARRCSTSRGRAIRRSRCSRWRSVPGATAAEAAELANLASGIAVGKVGHRDSARQRNSRRSCRASSARSWMLRPARERVLFPAIRIAVSWALQ